MFITLDQRKDGRTFELMVDTDKIDSLSEYQCRIVINGVYHSITPYSYEVVKNFMMNKNKGGN